MSSYTIETELKLKGHLSQLKRS